jgi:hypothetical protein
MKFIETPLIVSDFPLSQKLDSDCQDSGSKEQL